MIEPTYLASYGASTRIRSFRVEALHDGAWKDILSRESSSGVFSITETTAERVRLNLIANGPASPGVAELGIYAEPEGNR